jgi:hypothetical protein
MTTIQSLETARAVYLDQHYLKQQLFSTGARVWVKWSETGESLILVKTEGQTVFSYFKPRINTWLWARTEAWNSKRGIEIWRINISVLHAVDQASLFTLRNSLKCSYESSVCTVSLIMWFYMLECRLLPFKSFISHKRAERFFQPLCIFHPTGLTLLNFTSLWTWAIKVTESWKAFSFNSLRTECPQMYCGYVVPEFPSTAVVQRGEP